jgi:hypothetical protein
VESPEAPDRPRELQGRSVVAVIGIDRYAAWPELHNAVSDARGALALFTRLGFEPAGEPLLDQAATAEALRHLVADDLARLGPQDSLVLFFAGHGFTRTHHLANADIKTGYIIPADADDVTGRASTWVRLDSWLSDVARLPARHILVILDACHSGVALDAVIKWRGLGGDPPDEPLAELRARQSRRVITSALEDQLALDNGPVPGHSLFTGCLIEALTGGLARDGKRETTGSELGQYVQRRVATFPGSLQTPDFGTLEWDDRGELVLPLVVPGPPSRLDQSGPVPPREPGAPAQARPDRRRRQRFGYTTGVVLLALVLGSVAPGRCDEARPIRGPLPPPDATPPLAVGPIVDAALPPRDAMPGQADASTFDAALRDRIDAASETANAPPSLDARPRPIRRNPSCWVLRDNVHAVPQPCAGQRCAAECVSATSEDAPVRVPRSAFERCAEVWICG